MSESAAAPVNKNIVILLAIVALLLAAIAGLLIAKGNDVPDPTGTDSTLGAAGDASGFHETPMDGVGAAAGTAEPAADFDPTTAVQVPEGVEPTDYVASYYEAVLAGDWATAHGLQPMHKQSSVEEFQAQLEGYGITSYEILGSQAEGDQMYVGADQVTGAYGTFENQWVFLEYEGGWVVMDKSVTAMK